MNYQCQIDIKRISEVLDTDTKINHVTTEEYGKDKKQAYRPKNSRLDKTKLGDNFYRLPTWQDATDRYKKELVKVRKK